MGHAHSEGIPLIPRGAGTGMPGGNLGSGIVVALESGFRRVGRVHGPTPSHSAWPPAIDHPEARGRAPEGGRVRVGAGATAMEVEQRARAAGLRLPPLPSSAPWCTIGGMVASNAAGPRSFRFGSVAPWVAGLRGIDGEGAQFGLGSMADRGVPRPDSFARLADLDVGQVVEARAPEAGAGSEQPGEHGHPGAWPDVRKNSSGYALDRYRESDGDPLQLLIGNEGTLAILTEIDLHLAPIPPARGVALFPVHSPEELAETAQSVGEGLLSARGGVSACEFFGRRFLEISGLRLDSGLGSIADGAFALLLVEFEGSELEVDWELARTRDLFSGVVSTADPAKVERLWDLRHAASPTIGLEARRGRFSTQFIEDSVVPIHQLGRYVDTLETLFREENLDAVVFGHAGDGNVHVNPLLDLEAPQWEEQVRRVLEGVVDLVASLGGTLSGEHGDGRLRAPFIERIWGPTRASAFASVKRAFDPSGILNPGVVVPITGQDPLEGFAPGPRTWPR